MNTRHVIAIALTIGCCFLQRVQSQDLLRQRIEIDVRFQQSFDEIAARCDELGLKQLATVTRNWVVSRDPLRQYIFLPPPEDALKPDSSAPANEIFWYESFIGVRKRLAHELFELAKSAASAGEGAIAYQWLNEVLVHDPDQGEARRILGFQMQDGQWRRSSQSVKARQPKQRTRLFQWASGTYWLIESPHFEIYTSGAKESAIELSENLERWYWVWKQVFFDYWCSATRLTKWIDGQGSDASGSKRHKVFLFRDREHYLSDLASVPDIEESTGYYYDGKRASFFYLADPAPMTTWRHELVHQLFQEIGARRAVGRDHHFWLVEGIAMYFESMQENGSVVTLGGSDAPRLQFARLRLQRQGFFESLVVLNPMGRETFQKQPGATKVKLYSQSAGLAQFLMTADGGKYRKETIELLTQIYRGGAKPDSLARILGQELDQLDRQYKRFVELSTEHFRKYFQAGTQQGLALGRCGLTNSDLEMVGRCTDLQWLDLAENQIDDRGLNHIRHLDQLRQLFLDGTQLTDRAGALLLGLTALEELDLQGTQVGDEGFKQLAQLHSLKVIWLAATRITDEGLVALGDLPNLEWIDIRQTAVTDTAVEQLRKRRPNLEIVR